MVASTLDDLARRQEAVARLKVVADEMAWFVAVLQQQQPAPGLARGALALKARAGWVYAQLALIQADAGIASPRIVDAIRQLEPDARTPALRRLALSTLEASERRLHRDRPSACDPLPREASR